MSVSLLGGIEMTAGRLTFPNVCAEINAGESGDCFLQPGLFSIGWCGQLDSCEMPEIDGNFWKKWPFECSLARFLKIFLVSC